MNNFDQKKIEEVISTLGEEVNKETLNQLEAFASEREFPNEEELVLSFFATIEDGLTEKIDTSGLEYKAELAAQVQVATLHYHTAKTVEHYLTGGQPETVLPEAQQILDATEEVYNGLYERMGKADIVGKTLKRLGYDKQGNRLNTKKITSLPTYQNPTTDYSKLLTASNKNSSNGKTD